MFENCIFITSPLWLAVCPNSISGVFTNSQISVRLIATYCGKLEGLATAQHLNYTNLIAVVIRTDRLRLVRSRRVIEVFGSIFVLSLYFVECCSVGRTFYKDFCDRTESCLIVSNHSNWSSLGGPKSLCYRIFWCHFRFFYFMLL